MAVSAMQDAPTCPSTEPGAAELIERARAIGTLARDQALETEKQRHVSAALIGKMRDAELFRVMQPARFGGFEYGYDVFVEVVAAIAAGDGSTGWVYSLGAVHPWLLATRKRRSGKSGVRTATRLPQFPTRRPAKPCLMGMDIGSAGASALPAASTTPAGALSAACCPSRMDRSPVFSSSPDRNSRSMMTGSPWVSRAPEAKRS
jgi:hypothetical protein